MKTTRTERARFRRFLFVIRARAKDRSSTARAAVLIFRELLPRAFIVRVYGFPYAAGRKAADENTYGKTRLAGRDSRIRSTVIPKRRAGAKKFN